MQKNHKEIATCKAFTHTYRTHFPHFGGKTGGCCGSDFAHRLHSIAPNWHFLFVVVFVSLFLPDEQLVTVTRKVGRAFGYVFSFCGGHSSLCCNGSSMSFNFSSPISGIFFRFLRDKCREGKAAYLIRKMREKMYIVSRYSFYKIYFNVE